MLKCVVLCVLLWNEMCEFYIRARPSSTDTHTVNFPVRVSSNINDTDVQIEPKGNYYFNITININAHPRQLPPGKGYDVTNGIGAHKLHFRDLTWNEAREICINEGGDLVVISSYRESMIVRDMIHDSALDQVWIGFHNRFGKEDWTSVFNETLEENGWMNWWHQFESEKPNRCAIYHTSVSPYETGMVAKDCNSKKKFICEITTI